MPKYRKDEIRAPNESGVIQEISIDKIDPFPDHPYQVRDDEDMEQLVASIADRGLITPILVRKMYHGRYELISGHRRLHACKKLGMETIRSEVVEMTKEEAVIAMVESNLQRDRILPSEKAFAYKMRLDAMKMLISRIKEVKRKGGETVGDEPLDEKLIKANASIAKAYGISEDEIERIGTAASRRKDNSHPLGAKTRGRRTDELLATEVGESAMQIRRYIRLTELIPEILQLVDDGKLGMRTAVELSYLEHRQKDVFECMDLEQCTPTHAQAIRMRRMYEQGKLTPREIHAIMAEQKPNQKENIVLHIDRFEKLVPEGLSKRDREDYIEDALKHYARYLERKSRGQER
jgi:ParB family chromosome partitioning protein